MVKYRNTRDGSILELEGENAKLEASGRYELIEETPSGKAQEKDERSKD